MSIEDVRYRTAGAADAAAIGRLHADSWRRHYRGAYPDEFLDGDLDGERIAHWTELLGEAGDTQQTVLAEEGGSLAGFVHVELDADPAWGAVVGNLHVRSTHHRHGLGTELMARGARFVVERRPGNGLFLWVLKQNTAGQAFYAARGGACVEEADGPVRGGVSVRVLRYAWADPRALIGR